jgi:predicted small secreted protein
MKANNLLMGIGIGAVIGYFISKQVTELKVSPETTLKKVKDILTEVDEVNIDKITGSWIKTQTEKYVKNSIPYEVYSGGITCKKNGLDKQFSFIVDANTGTIIELQET